MQGAIGGCMKVNDPLARFPSVHCTALAAEPEWTVHWQQRPGKPVKVQHIKMQLYCFQTVPFWQHRHHIQTDGCGSTSTGLHACQQQLVLPTLDAQIYEI